MAESKNYEENFGLWKNWKISSEEYVRKLRKESKKA